MLGPPASGYVPTVTIPIPQLWVNSQCRVAAMFVSGTGGMQVLQYLWYYNTSGSLTPLHCRVENHCLVIQVLDRTEG